MKILVTEYTLKIMDYYKRTGKFIKHEILKPLKHYHERSICTPGMVMSMYTLPRSHPQSSEEQLPAALGGRSDLNKPTASQSQVGSCVSLFLPTYNATPAPFRDPSVVSEVAAFTPEQRRTSRCISSSEHVLHRTKEHAWPTPTS